MNPNNTLRGQTIVISILVVLLAVVESGCGSPQQVGEVSYAQQAEVAYDQAREALEDDNYTVALERFRQVRDGFELSPYAILAEIGMADTYFEQGTYLQAAEAYRQFIQLHPSHEAVPYARFRIGMSYFEDMPSDFFIFPPTYERELGSTRQAHDILNDFLVRYGDNPDSQIQSYVAEAREAFQETTDRLGGYEFYVAEFYVERNRPVAAAEHLTALLEHYPSTSRAPQAMFLLARCYVELSDVVSALEVIRQLETDFPAHSLTRRAQEWREEHGLTERVEN